MEDNDVIHNYNTMIEQLEETKTLLDKDNLMCYSVIREKFYNCSQLLDVIITTETNHLNFLALCQQKHQLTMLFNMMDNLELENQNFTNTKNITTDLPNFYNTNVHNEPSNTEEAKNNKFYNIYTSTTEHPKTRGLREIIGLYDIKKMLKSLVILPKTQPQLFYDRRICNTILLYGPPGTGKTRLTHALAAEADANFHCISAGDILSHYVGQTEKAIKSLFQTIRQSYQFTILFIDEIDAFCRKRTDHEQEHTRRIKTEFMCQMSSIEDCKHMIVICATNCPWDLDSAILRRLQKRIYVPLPNQYERLEFFQFLTNNNHFEENLTEWSLLVEKTNGYSGSDLCDVVQTAMNIPLNELEDTKVWKCCSDGFYEPVLHEQDISNVICSELCDLPSNSVRARKVRLFDLLTAVDLVKTTVSLDDVKKYEIFNGS